MDFNKVFISGTVLREPELFYTLKNRLILRLNIRVEDKKGANFFNVVVFDDVADFVNKKVKKDDRIIVEGRLKYVRYTTKSGVVKSRVEIVGEKVSIIDKEGFRWQHQINNSSNNSSQ